MGFIRLSCLPLLCLVCCSSQTGSIPDDDGFREQTLLENRFGPYEPGRTAIRFVNEMGTGFKLVFARVELDGEPIYQRQDGEGILVEEEGIELFSGVAGEGIHLLGIKVVYRWDSLLWVYVNDYQFTLTSSHRFLVREDAGTCLRVIASEKGNLMTPFEERPQLSFEVSTTSTERY